MAKRVFFRTERMEDVSFLHEGLLEEGFFFFALDGVFLPHALFVKLSFMVLGRVDCRLIFLEGLKGIVLVFFFLRCSSKPVVADLFLREDNFTLLLPTLDSLIGILWMDLRVSICSRERRVRYLLRLSSSSFRQSRGSSGNVVFRPETSCARRLMILSRAMLGEIVW